MLLAWVFYTKLIWDAIQIHIFPRLPDFLKVIIDALDLGVEDQCLNVQAFHHREAPVFEALYKALKLVKFELQEALPTGHFQYLDRR